MIRHKSVLRAVDMDPNDKYNLKYDYRIPNRYTQTDVLLSNLPERTQLLENLSGVNVSEDLQREVFSIFCNLLDVIPAFNNNRALGYAVDLWDVSMANQAQLPYLCSKLDQVRSVFVNVLINSRQYDLYEEFLGSRLSADPSSVSWTDKVASTLQFRADEEGHLTFNDARIVRFLKGSSSQKEKKQLISTFLKKGLLTSPGDSAEILESFLYYVTLVENSDFLLYEAVDVRYDVGLELLLKIREGDVQKLVAEIRSFFIGSKLPHQHCSNLLTTLIKAASANHPTVALEIFNAKADPEAHNILELRNEDLTFAMTAHFSLRQFHEAVMLYKEHTDLQHEDQLAIFLRISEKNRDWKLLQSQFEDMYGKGQLPYVLHYSIVMNSLAILGAQDTIGKLYDQLLMRKLTPTASIFAALIKSRIYSDDLIGAKELFDKHIESIKHDSEVTAADLYRIVLATYLKSPNIDEAMEFFEQSLQRQKEDKIRLIDAKIMCNMIDYMRGHFAFKEVETLQQIASDHDMLSEDVYASIIKSYTWFGQFELAERMVFEAHHESRIPLQSPSIYRCQLRNYRFWYRYNSDAKSRRFISGRRNFVFDFLDQLSLDPAKAQALYGEMIKFCLVRDEVSAAESYLEKIRGKVNAKEDVYTPFLAYFSKSDKTADHQRNLDIYKDMVERKVEISMKSYQYIMKSLVFLDEHNGQKYANCEKLIESLFDMNGLSMTSDKPDEKVIPAELEANALYLCRIVSTYVVPRSLTDISHATLLVNFLSQTKEVIKDRVPYSYRFTIYKEMGNLYQQTGNIQSTQSLIHTGLNELRAIISRYIKDYPLQSDVVIPRALQVEIRGLINLSLSILDTRKGSPAEYYELLQLSLQCKTQLSGDQYNQLIEKAMEMQNYEGLHDILWVLENYLVAGNFAEASYRRSLQYMYKLFILINIQKSESRSLLDTYSIYNDFYNVKSVEELREELAHVTNARKELETTLKRFNKRYVTLSDFSVSYVLRSPFAFFLPERELKTFNKLRPYLSNRLWFYVTDYARDDKTKLFKLMDEYPQAIEYLVYNQAHKTRLSHFRQHIDSMVAKPPGEVETSRERVERTVRALKRLA